MDIFWDGLLDALLDTLYVVPILYLAYLLVGYFSHNDNEKYSKILHKTKKAGPVIGAFLGCIPQCGFSSLMSQLYSRKMVTLGTLLAVFIATSDEAIPLMISQPRFIPSLLIMMAIKVVYAIIVGYIIDGIIRLISKKKPVLNEYHDKHEEIKLESGGDHEISKEGEKIEENPSEEIKAKTIEKKEEAHKHRWWKKCKCDHAHEEEDGHKHSHSHCCATNIFLDALHHTLIIAAYVLIATLAINLIRGYCGGLEPLQKFFTSNSYVQILLACVIGLIPNCAASVFLVELFMEGVLIFPALVAGLCAGAGVGLIVLFTVNYKKTWLNILITVLLLLLSIVLGIIINFIPIW